MKNKSKNQITEIQEFIEEKVIMAAHPEAKNYEEALTQELGFGCRIVINNEKFIIITTYRQDSYFLHSTETKESSNYLITLCSSHIIGKPLTLARVLVALEHQFKNEYHKFIFQEGKLLFICARYEAVQFYWNLTKTTLEEQTKKTQVRIAKLLGYEEVQND